MVLLAAKGLCKDAGVLKAIDVHRARCHRRPINLKWLTNPQGSAPLNSLDQVLHINGQIALAAILPRTNRNRQALLRGTASGKEAHQARAATTAVD